MGMNDASNSSCDSEASRLEQEVLSERAKGLSDLEVALKLLLDERTVRSILRRHRMRQRNARVYRPVLNDGRALEREAGRNSLRWGVWIETERPPQPPHPEPPKPPEPPPPSPPRPGADPRAERI